MGRYWGILALAAALAIPARAEDWTTTDGQTYHNVKVMSHDDAYVTILDSDGGGRVPLRTLGPELQKRFGYDAAKAAASEAATLAADKRDRDRLAAQQAAALATPPPPVAPVQPPAPSPQAVTGSSPAKPPPKKSAVDVAANNAKIEEDKKELEDLQVDIRVAQRELNRDGPGFHYDGAGTTYSNTIGNSPRERLRKCEEKKLQLEAEIKELEDQNTSMAQ